MQADPIRKAIQLAQGFATRHSDLTVHVLFRP
ncbi:protein of unknown function [Streptomyces murinus]